MLFCVSEYLLFILIWYNLLSIFVIIVIISVNVSDWLMSIMTVYIFFRNSFRNLAMNIFSSQFNLYVNVWNCDAYMITEFNCFNLNNFFLIITSSSESSKVLFNFTTKFSKCWKIYWVSSFFFELKLIGKSSNLNCIHFKASFFKNEETYNIFAVLFLYCNSFIINWINICVNHVFNMNRLSLKIFIWFIRILMLLILIWDMIFVWRMSD